MDAPRVIVVGAGLAGLTAALEAARVGAEVVLFDGNAGSGGRARSTGPDGYALNLGPHAIASQGPGTRVLERLGIDVPGNPPPLHRARLLVDGQIVSSWQRRAGAGGLRTGVGLARLVADARRGDPDGSVAEWLGRRLPDPRARATAAVLVRLATYADSFEVQAADVLAEGLRSGTVRYLHGGWGGLVDRLQAAAVTAGVDLRSGVAVDAVDRDGDGWCVIARDGEHHADAVVLAAGGPRDTARLLTGETRATVDGWADRATPIRMACLDVALTRRPDGLPGAFGVFGVDEPLYLSIQSDVSDVAPAGGAVVQVARFLPAGEQAPTDTRARLEALLTQALPDWADHVVQARYLPDLVVTHDAALVATGGRRGRPGPQVPDAPGLFVVGDWVGTRGTLAQASIASGSAAARHILRGTSRAPRPEEAPA